MKELHIYWVGPRDSDIFVAKNLFHGSITIFGDGNDFGEGKDKNYAYCLSAEKRRNHNVNDLKENEFFFDKIEELIKKDPQARFLFYNPNAVFFIYSADNRRLDCLNTSGQFLCVNTENVMKKANDKRCFADLLKQKVPLLFRNENVFSTDGDYPSLLRSFGRTMEEHPRFVFQAPISSGGNGTFLVSDKTDKKVIRELSRDQSFIVTVYEEKNIPINIHAVIFKDHIVLTPGSVQIIKEGANNHGENRLLYRGADYIAYNSIDDNLLKKFEDAVIEACKVYQSEGYLGVCGIDGMICGEKVYLLEMNNRFQASTSLINRAAIHKGLPTLFELNLAAFSDEWDDSYNEIHNLKINYSNFSFASTDEVTKLHTEHIYRVCSGLTAEEKNKIHVVDMELDGYSPDKPMEELAYMFRLVFDKSITSVGPDFSMFINENIAEPNKSEWFDHLDLSIHSGDLLTGKDPNALLDFLLHLKIGLLVQGVTIEPDVRKVLEESGGIREATNNAIDIRIELELDPLVFSGKLNKYLIINAPIDIDFVEFSPFSIGFINGKKTLFYYGKFLTYVETYPIDSVGYKKENGKYVPRMTTAGKKSVRYDEIAFLSTDRLRVHITNHCIFKARKEGCHFCNIKPSEDLIEPENIKEVVTEYCNSAKDIGLMHFLVGGQTAAESDKRLVTAIRIIRDAAPYRNIYAMIVPCSRETLRELYNAGLNQISCNIEVFDDKIAKEIMPGKRKVDKNAYKQCLINATRYFGRDGDVRTMVIIGLEPHESLVNGIKEFTAVGIQPILSVFRPLPGTELGYKQAPPMLYIKRVYYELSEICRRNGLSLGPSCVNCQNNTLALPLWLEKAVK